MPAPRVWCWTSALPTGDRLEPQERESEDGSAVAVNVGGGHGAGGGSDGRHGCGGCKGRCSGHGCGDNGRDAVALAAVAVETNGSHADSQR